MDRYFLTISLSAQKKHKGPVFFLEEKLLSLKGNFKVMLKCYLKNLILFTSNLNLKMKKTMPPWCFPFRVQSTIIHRESIMGIPHHGKLLCVGLLCGRSAAIDDVTLAVVTVPWRANPNQLVLPTSINNQLLFIQTVGSILPLHIGQTNG